MTTSITAKPAYWAVGAAILLAIGSIGPWAQVTIFGITLTVAGTSGDGRITLALAVAAAVLLVFFALRVSAWLALATIAVGGGAVATSIYDLVNISKIHSGVVSPGWGLYLTVISSLALVVLAVVVLRTALVPEAAVLPVSIEPAPALSMAANSVPVSAQAATEPESEAAPPAPTGPDKETSGRGPWRWRRAWFGYAIGAAVVVVVTIVVLVLASGGSSSAPSTSATTQTTPVFATEISAPLALLDRSALTMGNSLDSAVNPKDVAAVNAQARSQLAAVSAAQVTLAGISASPSDQPAQAALLAAAAAHRSFLAALIRATAAGGTPGLALMGTVNRAAVTTMAAYRRFFALEPTIPNVITSAGLTSFAGLRAALTAQAANQQSATSNPGGTVPPAARQESAVLQPLFNYWSDLQDQDYAAAFDYLTPGNQQRLGGLATFVSGFQEDPLLTVTDTFALRSVSGASATVDIAVLQTQGASTGCRNWSGSYQLAYQGSQWLIDRANLSYLAC